jgi:hypothetical protein
VHALLLKTTATVVTLGAAALSAVYVTGHVKNPASPLHPSVLGVSSSAQGGRLTLTPSIKSANVEAVTSTYAS